MEIEDNEGKPIKVNAKFRENHPNMDLSEKDVIYIKDKVLKHSAPMHDNQKKLNELRKKKKPRI